MIYPVSEHFISPQGEGVHAGTLMFFLRLAGCNVGQRYPAECYTQDVVNPFPVYTNKCTTWDGREFACDTDYRAKHKIAEQEILNLIPKDLKHVCITGGEPLMHDLKPLLDVLIENEIHVHIESSGTKMLSDELIAAWHSEFFWLTISPKLGCLDRMIDYANEVKLLIDEHFDEARADLLLANYIGEVFIQPINFEHKVNEDNMKRCLEIQLRHPSWRLSAQYHKIWGVR